MNGSDDIQVEELTAFMAGTADEATRQKVSQALNDPDHGLSYMLTRAKRRETEPSHVKRDIQVQIHRHGWLPSRY